MTPSRQPLHVFIAYAHDDKKAIRNLYNRMAREGVQVWLDEEKILPGQDWEYEIRKAIRRSDVIIVCLSKQFSRQRGYRQKELRIALEEANLLPEGAVFIIPVRLEECEVPENLRRWQYVDLFEPDGFKKLMRAVQRRAASA
jgi:TIR domain